MMKRKYKLYGLTIETEVELMQLEKESDRSTTDVYIKEEKCADEVIEYLTKSGSIEAKYEIGLNYSCFMNKGGYYVIRDGKEILFETKEGYTP